MRRVNIKGIALYIRDSTCDEGVAAEVIDGDCYQLNKIKLRKHPNIVDVGAHIGSFTRLAATLYPMGQFYLYEANKNNWNILSRNLREIEARSTVFKGACVGAIPKNPRLIINAAEATTITGGWGINFSTEEVHEPSTVATQEIENFYSLNTLLASLDKIDVLKLDCEGSEFSIVKELSEAELHRIDYIVAEVHCGALSHAPMTYHEFRTKILKQFLCPQLEARKTYKNQDIFNIVACNKKLIK